MNYALQQSAMLSASARILAPEVASVAFRYFDGTTWNSTWDSAYVQKLPLAVEVTIGVRMTNEAGTAGRLASAGDHVYRHVIPITTMPPQLSLAEMVNISIAPAQN